MKRTTRLAKRPMPNDVREALEDGREGLREARWPARLEPFGDVYLDGAHNPHAARALARALPPILDGRPLHVR